MSTLSKITAPIKRAFQERERYLVYKEYSEHFKSYMLKHNYDPEQVVEGEDEYRRVWGKICDRIEPYSYRFFSHYIGKNRYIVPEDLGRTYIEYYLNPLPYRAFYSDKNMYEQYLRPESAFPKAYLRRINGGILLNNSFLTPKMQGGKILSFNSLAQDIADYIPVDKVVLKKSVDSGGGHSVLCFTKKSGVFYNTESGQLTGEFLHNFAGDFVIQEVIIQHPFFSQFCETSLNTMRLYVYRSVKDETITIYSALLRIGNTGSFIDNLTQGGMSVSIDIKTGKVGAVVVGQLGFLHSTHNGIDFSKNEFIVPCWEQIKEFAVNIARQNRHCHMIALDLTMDADNRIRMIEYNVGDNSYWLSMYFSIQPFGDRIQEVIDYCIEQKKKDPRFRK